MIFIFCIFIIICFYYNKKGIPWFLYHHIGEKGVSTEWFEEHLKIISYFQMKTLTNRDILDQLKNKGKISKNSVAITFDDGYYDNYINAYPLLKKYNLKSILYLNTAYVEKENHRAYKYLSWSEIKEMSDSGLVDIQLHSHRHMPIFINTTLDRIVNKQDLMDREIQYLYDNQAKIGYPLFGKRGEFSTKGILISLETAKKFKNYYDSLNEKEEEKILLCQKYIDTVLKEEIKNENFKDAKNRVLEDLNQNISLIEDYCGYRPTFFCWPWGHKSPEFIKILKEAGILGFVTTRKGTNSIHLNLENIKRIELRKFTPFKFKINLLICRNYFLGRIYQLLS